MTIDKLSEEAIKAGMNRLHQWDYNAVESCIAKEWRFKDFKMAIAFLVKVSELAEIQNHHPEILSTYTCLRIKLWTHDAQGLTHKDFELAEAIDCLFAQQFSI
ncbi:MAG: putative pterin-4-alpha-carbinolamine dehydratase [Pseudomonadota bacterium]|jgi:4a-hydroxytetrahydrobiopterin dehydratase